MGSMEGVMKTSDNACCYPNVLTTMVVTTGGIREVTVDGTIGGEVTRLVFLVAFITKCGVCDKVMRRRAAMGKAVMEGRKEGRNIFI